MIIEVKYQLRALFSLFVVTFLMHKPFNIHQTKSKFWKVAHYTAESAFSVLLCFVIFEMIFKK